MFKNNLRNDETFPILTNANKKTRGNVTYGTDGSSSYNQISSEEFDLSPYPIAVIFVLLSKTFEAFSANGIRSVLALYTRDSLKLSEELSSVLLHTFNFFSQFLPIVGAIFADSYLGNVKTIFLFFIPYAVGYFGMFMGTLPYEFATNLLTYASLLFISIGNGCIRACITALGGHQFKLPQQKHSLEDYFGIYYFFYYFGILLGKIIPPEIRVSVDCVNIAQCYTAVFGVIGLMFLISWAIFLCGLPIYKKETPVGDNTMLKVLGCISHGLTKRLRGHSGDESWIRGAVGKYSKEFVNDVEIFLKVLKLFMPLPIYYALLSQQDSTWTFQATQTNTAFGSFNIQADQFKALGPILLLIQIPIWQRIVMPWMQRHDFHLTSLESVSVGGICAGFSFICSGFLQYYIEAYPENPPHVIWQLPQFFLIMLGEVLISVPGLKFSYTHAPSSMKSVLTAVWFINNAMGNLIVVIITELQLVERQSAEFFFYSVLMFIGTIIFTILANQFHAENVDSTSVVSDEQNIERYIYVDDVTSTNLEENFLDDEEIETDITTVSIR